jgi:uncharacterized protein
MRTHHFQITVVIVAILFTLTYDQECRAQQAKKPTLVEGQLFRPYDERQGDWQPRSLNYQDVEFESADGTHLHGWFCQRDKPRAIVLFSHGNEGNVAIRAGFMRVLQTRLNVSIFIYDYRGYGKSQGVPTIEGALQDARAARVKLCELTSIKDSDMVLMGDSLGGAFSVQLAAESAPRALVLQSTFSSLRDAADQLYPNVAFLVGRDLLDSKTRIADVSCPLFQSHGDADRTISIRLGKKLFREAKEPKTFFEVAGADHNDWLTEGYLQGLAEFVKRL